MCKKVRQFSVAPYNFGQTMACDDCFLTSTHNENATLFTLVAGWYKPARTLMRVVCYPKSAGDYWWSVDIASNRTIRRRIQLQMIHLGIENKSLSPMVKLIVLHSSTTNTRTRVISDNSSWIERFLTITMIVLYFFTSGLKFRSNRNFTA